MHRQPYTVTPPRRTSNYAIPTMGLSYDYELEDLTLELLPELPVRELISILVKKPILDSTIPFSST